MTPTPVSIDAVPEPRAAVTAAIPELSAALGGRVSTTALDRVSTARETSPLGQVLWSRGEVGAVPDAVVWPSSHDDVVALVKVARARMLALFPYGAGSGRSRELVASGASVCVDLKRLDVIGSIDTRARTVEVGAGVIGSTLERRLNARGWTTGHWPESLAMSTVGGWLSTRARGQGASVYGGIEDLVRSIRGVYGTGETFEVNLPSVLLGSEGALCIFTSATLQVQPVAAARAYRAFEAPTLERGLEMVRRLVREGLTPTRLSLAEWTEQESPNALVEQGRAALARWPKVLGALSRLRERCELMVIYEGGTRQVERQARAASAAVLSLGGVDRSEAPARAWDARRGDGPFRQGAGVSRGLATTTLSTFVHWSVAPRLVSSVREAVSRLATVSVALIEAHAEGGVVRFTVQTPIEESVVAAVQRVMRGAIARHAPAVQLVGSVGLDGQAAYQEGLGEARHALAALKRQFDPSGVLNPGKWVG